MFQQYESWDERETDKVPCVGCVMHCCTNARHGLFLYLTQEGEGEIILRYGEKLRDQNELIERVMKRFEPEKTEREYFKIKFIRACKVDGSHYGKKIILVTVSERKVKR